MRRSQHREPKLRQVARNLDDKVTACEQDLATIIYNERITRSRVDTLEAFFGMPWYERVWWMLTGRSKYFTVVESTAVERRLEDITNSVTEAVDDVTEPSEANAMPAPERIQ